MIIQIKTRGIEGLHDGARVTHVSNLTILPASVSRAVHASVYI